MTWDPRSLPDQTGRTAVVTGASSGLGLESTVGLAAAGAHVVMAARDLGRAEAARAVVLQRVPAASVEVSLLDLADLGDVRAFAERTLIAHPRLHLLLDNAGIMATPPRRTADGFELQLGTNHLGHFALTALLWPALVDTVGARVVTVTSVARHAGRPVTPAGLDLQRYDPWRAYGRSKLANAVFGYELHRRCTARGRTASSLLAHPGYSNTNLQHTTARVQGGLAARFFSATVPSVGMTAREGAAPQLRAATDPEARSGEMYVPRGVISGVAVQRRPERRVRSADAGAALWALSEDATGVSFPV